VKFHLDRRVVVGLVAAGLGLILGSASVATALEPLLPPVSLPPISVPSVTLLSPAITTPAVTTPVVTTPAVTTPPVTTPLVTVPPVSTALGTTPAVTSPSSPEPTAEVTHAVSGGTDVAGGTTSPPASSAPNATTGSPSPPLTTPSAGSDTPSSMLVNPGGPGATAGPVGGRVPAGLAGRAARVSPPAPKHRRQGPSVVETVAWVLVGLSLLGAIGVVLRRRLVIPKPPLLDPHDPPIGAAVDAGNPVVGERDLGPNATPAAGVEAGTTTSDESVWATLADLASRLD
jgi:hypothetical protein